MKILNTAVLVLLFMLSSGANAALESRLGGLAYYDTDADLTWLADASGGYSGLNLNWPSANSAAAGLDVDGVTGWRLAKADASCANPSNCATSELGNMFYNVLGGTAGTSIIDSHKSNFDLFTNVALGYWTGDQASGGLFPTAYSYSMNTGQQGTSYISNYTSQGIWAVYDGDLSQVPIPAPAWLFGSALLGLAGIKRKRA